MEKFFTVLTVLLFVATFFCKISFANAEKNVSQQFEEDVNSLVNVSEKYFDSLPQTKDKYKSSRQPLLISGATDLEIEKLVRSLENPTVYKYLNYFYVAGTYKDYPVIVSRTEMGMTNAAASTALAIENFNPVAVVNQGTAGAYIPTLKVCDIVIAEKTFPNSAFIANFQPLGEGTDFEKHEFYGVHSYDKTLEKFTATKYFYSDSTMLKIAESVKLKDKNINVVKGVIASSDIWNNELDQIKFLNENFGSVCEDMETQSVAQVCRNADVPFIGIRVISNNITSGESFLPSAVEVGQNFVLKFVEKYISDVLEK